MSRFVVEILPAAEAEFREAFLWYFARSALAADAFRVEVFHVIDQLERRADMWPEDEDSTRKCVLRHFPYTIYYEVVDSIVTVLAVGHQRRRPGYWQER